MQYKPIVFALDFDTKAEAMKAAYHVAPAIGLIKIGLELFMAEGPDVVSIGKELNLPVMLDLKLHDIPETVERAVTRAGKLGVRYVTVHAAGGAEMLYRAAKKAGEFHQLGIIAVTLLTSLNENHLRAVGIEKTPLETAVLLAKYAYEAGIRDLVCSPQEVGAMRKEFSNGCIYFTPGCRPAGADVADQQRVATPEQAIADGADYVVIGRPIRDAPDRLKAASDIYAACAKARTR